MNTVGRRGARGRSHRASPSPDMRHIFLKAKVATASDEILNLTEVTDGYSRKFALRVRVCVSDGQRRIYV